MTYLLLDSSLEREHTDEIQSRLLQFWALYQIRGLDLLTEESLTERLREEWQFYFVRVAGVRNETLFLYVPDHWQNFEIDRFEAIIAEAQGRPIKLYFDRGGSVVETTSISLHDGNLLQIGINIENRIRTLARFRGTFVIVALPLVLLGFCGGLFFSNRSLRPVAKLITAIKSIIATGKLNTRIPSSGTGDELDELVLLFNGMLAKIDTLVGGMRAAMDNVAHDLRTPLTRLSGRAELALRPSVNDADRKKALWACIEDASGILTMLNTLMDISEAETGAMILNLNVANLCLIVVDIAELYRYPAEEKGLSIAVNVPDQLLVSLDLNRMRQVLANLLDNAVKYTPAGGSIKVEALEHKDKACVSVKDTGIGVAGEEVKLIWDRLYRGDRSRATPGLGLGLALVRAIISAHGGAVAVTGEPGQGSTFTLTLPLSPTARVAKKL